MFKPPFAFHADANHVRPAQGEYVLIDGNGSFVATCHVLSRDVMQGIVDLMNCGATNNGLKVFTREEEEKLKGRLNEFLDTPID